MGYFKGSAAALLLALSLDGAATETALAAGDFPTAAVSDYVFVCMNANGQARDAIARCSCAIDVIASIIPYERFVAAETFKRMGQVPGEKGVIFRESAPAKSATSDLQRAQIEAEMRCF